MQPRGPFRRGGSAGRAYLLKERVSEPGQLVAAVHAVSSGGSVVDPTIVDLLVSDRTSSSPLSTLTPRELEVLDQVAQGKSNANVAATLFLTERTVDSHVKNLRRKIEPDPTQPTIVQTVTGLFMKLALPATPDVNRRVAAVLMHLSARDRA